MKIRLFITSLFLFLVFNGISQSVEWKKPLVEKYVLENGLTVILNEDHTRPIVYGIVVTKAGSKNDPADATGMAHYQEHMLFKGTEQLGTTNWASEKPHIDKIFALYEELGKTTDIEKRKEIQQNINSESLEANKYAIPNELDKIIKSIGGIHLNANTSNDRTVFHNAFPPNQMNKWLEIYSERFINPVFRGFQSELEVVYEEKNLYSDMFQAKLFEEFSKKFFKNHPYGQQPLIGTIEHLKNPSLNKMFNFFQTYYVANNMALVLSGDFNTKETLELIKEKFGKWKKAALPEPKTWKEEPFNGREFVEMNLSPIKLGMLGYRTVPAGDKDEVAIEVCNGILSNQNQTGLLDKLTIDHELLAAQAFSMDYNDYGQTILFIVPKILGQKLEDAEALVMQKLDDLRKGNFDDWLVEAIKAELYRDFMHEMENVENRSMFFAELFGRNQDFEDAFTIPDKINAITKQDVINIANKYYGKNYLAFYSRMGFPKKEKIDKPGFKPVISNTDAKSEFGKHLDSIPSNPIKEKFVDFRADVEYNRIKKGTTIYQTKNPYNDIFSLTIKYGMGETYHQLLNNAVQLIDLCGTKDYKVSELKNEFSKIGCTYYVSSNKDYTIIELEGKESQLKPALILLGKLTHNPVCEPNKLDIIIDGEKSNRKIESDEPDNVADALFQWLKYRNKSSLIARPTLKELKNVGTDSLLSVFKLATNFEAEVHYVGNLPFNEVISELKNDYGFTDRPTPTLAPSNVEITKYNENTVFLVDKSKALQSKIYFLINEKPFYNDDEPYIDAFNMYFGGSFSGLVLQEVREFRSLAYSAGARYAIPQQSGKDAVFYGYIGTQSDKTIEAVSIFDSLIRKMPLKPERMATFKEYLVQSSIAEHPDFRDLSQSIAKWKLLGYKEDPSESKIPVYYELTFDDIKKFSDENLKSKPMVIGIVGNAKRIDQKQLAKYGKIVKIKQKSLFRN